MEYQKHLLWELKRLKLWVTKNQIWTIFICFILYVFTILVLFFAKSGLSHFKFFDVFIFIIIYSPWFFMIIWMINSIFVGINEMWFETKRFIVLIATMSGLAIGYSLIKFFPDWVMNLQSVSELGINLQKSKIELKETSLLTLISAPIVFVLWTYREKNEQDKIENQRFDTNIKYFEQIQERLKDIVPLNDEKESSPEIHLKVAAILQLADFIQGRYGENLRRPAFQLLLSVWETYVRPSYEKQTKEYHDDHDKNVSYRSVLVNDRLMQTLNLALMKGLTDKNLAASEPKKATFKGFEYDLSGLFLVGLHTTFAPDTQLIFKEVN